MSPFSLLSFFQNRTGVRDGRTIAHRYTGATPLPWIRQPAWAVYPLAELFYSWRCNVHSVARGRYTSERDKGPPRRYFLFCLLLSFINLFTKKNKDNAVSLLYRLLLTFRVWMKRYKTLMLVWQRKSRFPARISLPNQVFAQNSRSLSWGNINDRCLVALEWNIFLLFFLFIDTSISIIL